MESVSLMNTPENLQTLHVADPATRTLVFADIIRTNASKSMRFASCIIPSYLEGSRVSTLQVALGERHAP